MSASTIEVLATDTAAKTSLAEAVAFWVLGALAVVCALGVVLAARAMYSAVFLAMTMIVLAVFYFAQDAMFLGVVQIVVYTGAVMTLFLFVMMLIGIDSVESLTETLRGQRIAAVAAGIGFGVLAIAGIGGAAMPFTGLSAANAGGNVEGLAVLVFSRYLWAFESTSALLITAAMAAMVLAHRERFGSRVTQRQLSVERFAHGRYPTPLPGPGVYARRNALNVAARLPDGSCATVSVPQALQHRVAGIDPEEPAP